MPRIGVLCCQTGEDLTDAQALRCCQGNTPTGEPCSVSYEMLRGILDDSGRATAYLSATMLTGCRRQTWLKAREPYRIYPHRSFPSFRGTLGHMATERWPEPGYLYEQRFEAHIPGISQPLTGAIDKLGIHQKAIADFKTKKDTGLPTQPESSHIIQLNVYRWLVFNGWPQHPFRMKVGKNIREFNVGEPAGIEIDKLTLIYWSMSRVVTLDVPVLPLDEVEEIIMEGLYELDSDTIPPIPPDLNPSRHPLCRDWCPVNAICERRMLNGE